MQNKCDWRKASRNVYSTEFKMRMVELALLPGASIAAIARENRFNDNLLFKWLRLWNTEGRLTRREQPARAHTPVLLPVEAENYDTVLPEDIAPAATCRPELRHGSLILENFSCELLRCLIRELSGRAPA